MTCDMLMCSEVACCVGAKHACRDESKELSSCPSKEVDNSFKREHIDKGQIVAVNDHTLQVYHSLMKFGDVAPARRISFHTTCDSVQNERVPATSCIVAIISCHTCAFRTHLTKQATLWFGMQLAAQSLRTAKEIQL